MHALHKRYLPCLSIDVIVGSTQTSPTFMSFQSELKIGLQHCGRQSCGGEQYIRVFTWLNSATSQTSSGMSPGPRYTTKLVWP